LSKNLESLACTLFLSTLGLGSTPFVLYINLLLHFCAFLIKSGDLCLSFFFTRLWRIFFLFFIVARLHACAVCIALPAGLAVVPTQGFYFAFAVFLLFLEKKICFGSEGVARDKLVFGMFETWSCVISNFDLDPFVVWIFWTKP